MALEDFYNLNPVSVVDQNVWLDRVAEVTMNFQRGPSVFTPLIDWTDRSRQTGAQQSQFTDLLEGDINADEIALTANYIAEPQGVDSRARTITTARYGDKVQMHKSSNIFQMWRMSGGRDWRPLLRGLLGNNVRRKLERLARDAFLRGPQAFWTYGGSATNFQTIDATSKFTLNKVNEWNLRLGNTGTPVIPGDMAAAKLAIVSPGSVYDFQQSIAAASANEAALWLLPKQYAGEPLRYEIGEYKGIRFVVNPNDNYGENSSVLYNCGAVEVQKAIKAPITAGDGSPDPATTKVDDVWAVGQKNVTHYITLDSFTSSDFAVNDIVTIHTLRTSRYGVTNGVDPLSGKTIQRRVVAVDDGANTLSFDRPIMTNYSADLTSGGLIYGYVTKGVHVAMNLVQGSRGAILGNVNKPIEFYEPVPVDDFMSVYRFVWDIIAGYNIWDPHVFELHFTAVSLPKIGGVISPS